MSVHPAMRAAMRLTPRMAAYHLRRVARNKTVPMLPAAYDRRIRTAAAGLPSPGLCDRIPPDLASFIGAFYRHTDDEMRDAAHGAFTLLGQRVDFGSIARIDWTYHLPEETDCYFWRMKLAQLGVLHSLIVSNDPAHHATAIALLNSFIDSRSFVSQDAFTIGWSPYDTSHRLLALLSSLSIVGHRGSSIAAGVRGDLDEFVQLDAGFLWRNVEHEMRNNHTERNLAALCLYHLAAGSISPARAKLLDRHVYKIVRSTVLADGMQVERSAMYQGLTVMSLRIFAACPFLSTATRKLASGRAYAAARAWLFLTHQDGEIALFNDSWIGEVPAPATILDSDSITLPSALPEAGYFRITSGTVDAILDAGEIGPRWNPAHGHPDFLALEVDVQGRRFIVDPGTSQYSTGPQRTYERSSASHNGPCYSGTELVEYLGRFKVGKLHRAVAVQATDLAKLSVVAIGGQISTSAGSCTRVACQLPSGGLLVIDRWESPQPGATTILISSEWSIDAEYPTIVRARSTGAETMLAVYQGQLNAVRTATWCRYYGKPEPAASIALEPERAPAGFQQLVFGIGVVQVSEVSAIRAEVETHILSR